MARKRNKVNKIIAAAMVFSVATSLVGCGKKHYKTPKLREPQTRTDMYKPVERGDVSEKTIIFGVVSPIDYPHFWRYNTLVDEIYVEVGDYVEEGDKIAGANVESLKEQIAALNNRIEQLQSNKDYAVQSYEYNRRIAELKLDGCSKTGDADGCAYWQNQIALLDENNNYDVRLSDLEISICQREIAKINNTINEGTLYAQHSGYVSYVKSLDKSSDVEQCENVVVISDYEDSCIVAKKEDTSNNWTNTLDRYTEYYVMNESEKIEIEKVPYKSMELVLSENKSAPLKLKYDFVDKSKRLDIGASVAITAEKCLAKDVLIVTPDTVSKDEKGYYVYVKEGDTKVARYIEIGEKNAFAYEVKSGLSEGELLYYQTPAAVPKEYDSLQIESTDFSDKLQTNAMTGSDHCAKKIYSSYDGKIDKFYVEEGQEIKKGEKICDIEVNEGGGEIASINANISELNDTHQSVLNNLDAKKIELNNELANLSDAPSMVATPTDAEEEKKPDPNRAEEISLELQEIDVQIAKENSNYNYQMQAYNLQKSVVGKDYVGGGKMCMRTEFDGIVHISDRTEGSPVKTNQAVYTIERNTKLQFSVKTKEPLYLGQVLHVKDLKTKETYDAKVVGYKNGQRTYAITYGDNSFITSNISVGSEEYIIAFDDETAAEKIGVDDGFDITAETMTLKGVITTSKFAIGKTTENKTEKNYVWRIVNGEMVYTEVQVIANAVKGDDAVLVIDGLKEGDTIVVPKGSLEEEEDKK